MNPLNNHRHALILGIVIAVVFVATLVGFLRAPSRRRLPPAQSTQSTPSTVATATVPAS